MRERSRQARNHPIPTDETQRKFDTMVCDFSQKSKNASYHYGNSIDSCILSFLAYLQGCYIYRIDVDYTDERMNL